MTIAHQALMTSIGYFVPLTWNWYHGQCMTERPIVVATCVGALLGNIKLGVVCGGQLETIYMGVVNIGGAMAAETVSATAIATSFVVGSGMDLDTALTAVAIPVGLSFNVIKRPLGFINYLWAPLWKKLAGDGNITGMRIFQVIFGMIGRGINTVLIYICVLLGAEPLANALAAIPDWLNNGLNAASGLLGAVGMAVLVRMLWSNELASWFFLGFTMFKYLNLPLVAIAVFAVCIIIPIALRDLELIDIKAAAQASGTEEEDFF